MLTGRRDHAAPLLWGVQSISSSRHIDATGVERLDSKLISVAFSKRSVATAARRGMRRNVDSRHNACKGSLRKDSHVHRIDPGEPQPVASGLTSAANPLEPLDALRNGPTAEIEDQLPEGSNVSGDAFRFTGEGPTGFRLAMECRRHRAVPCRRSPTPRSHGDVIWPTTLGRAAAANSRTSVVQMPGEQRCKNRVERARRQV